MNANSYATKMFCVLFNTSEDQLTDLDECQIRAMATCVQQAIDDAVEPLQEEINGRYGENRRAHLAGVDGMKTVFKFIEFVEEPSSKLRVTKIWACKNRRSGDELGGVAWYVSWRQYCFVPAEGTIFSRDCLRDVATFLEEAMVEHRTKCGSLNRPERSGR